MKRGWFIVRTQNGDPYYLCDDLKIKIKRESRLRIWTPAENEATFWSEKQEATQYVLEFLDDIDGVTIVDFPVDDDEHTDPEYYI